MRTEVLCDRQSTMISSRKIEGSSQALALFNRTPTWASYCGDAAGGHANKIDRKLKKLSIWDGDL